MVLATKSRNTNLFVRFIAAALSVLFMAGSAFFVLRVIETGVYTQKVETILQGNVVSDGLSESREVTGDLYRDITFITESLYIRDEKGIEKTLLSQKEEKLNKLLNEFKESKINYENSIKELEKEADVEYDEEGDAVETTAVDTADIDSNFSADVNFNYKDLSFCFDTAFWNGSENGLSLKDSEDVAKKKLEAMFNSYIKDKKYLNSFDGGYSRDGYEPAADLKYYAVNTKNKLVVTNFEKNEKTDGVLDNRYALTIKNNKPTYSLAFENVLAENTESKTGEINFTDRDIEYYLYVDEKADVNNGYLEEINNFFGVMEYSVSRNAAGAIILFILSLICAVWYFMNAGTRKEDGKVKRAFVDYIPSDVHLALTGGIIAGLCALYIPLTEALDSSVAGRRNHILFMLIASVITGGIWAFLVEFISSLIRVCKSEKKLYNNLLTVILFKYCVVKPIAWIFRKLKSLLAYKPDNFKHRFTRYIILYGVMNLILFIIAGATKYALFDFLIVVFNAAIVACGIWYGVQLDKIITAAHYRTVPQVDYNKLPQSLKTLYNSLRYTQQELDTAVTKAVRDERMRSELITNVSHDLKTPLTSIITYVDLLKTCDIDDKDAKDYLNVLDEKSNRLKRLIDDLIEASKITSGVITLNPVNLSLTELAAQSVGERSREFTENGLELVFDGSKTVGCFADGNKTFRVLENLLSNAKKYSLKGTRVYCSVYETQNFSIFEIKNTSAEPLNITAAELKERFVRGDKSRTNEGNGLGLSIADNLCRAQGGHLNITIDGDLFKAQVMLPKSK